MTEQQITNLPTRDAPLTRVTKDSEEFVLLNVKASFDGSAAATAFVPAVRIVSDSGQEVGTYPADDQVAAGGSADATFAPFLRNKRGEIRFNRLNVGGWLNVRTTSNLNPDGGGVTFEVEKGDFAVFVDPATGDTLRLSAGFLFFDANAGIFRFTNSSLFDVAADQFTVDSPDGIDLESHGNSVTVQGTEVNVTLHHVGDTLTVFDHLNHPIFRVDEDGDLHGKTGKALVFDL